MKLLSQSLLLGSLLLGLVACQKESSVLVAPPLPPPAALPPEVFEVVQDQNNPDRSQIVPKLDILFEIDDSESMANHQNNLVKNIDRFVDAFAKDSAIDFHIGVTSIYDSVRYGRIVPEGRFDRLGQLKPLKAPAGKEGLLRENEVRFVTRREGFKDILSETMKIGVSKYVPRTEGDKIANGPEFEELFSPVLAILDPNSDVSQTTNKGFRRKGAHFALVKMTDADDSTPYFSPESFVAEMLSFLDDPKGENLSTFAVIIPSKQGTSANCKRDPVGKPERIERVIRQTNGDILNLCQNFGPQLAKMGDSLRQRLLGRLEIPFDRIPDVSEKVLITYGGKEIPERQGSPGWTYNSRNRSFVILGIDTIPATADAKIEIEFVAVNFARVPQ